MPFTVIAAAILIGAICTWPALLLYEWVLKTMAYLEGLAYRSEPARAILLRFARYIFGFCWMVFFLVGFFGLPMHFFPANPYEQAVLGYIFSFCAILFLRYIPFDRRMRALGIALEQRGRREGNPKETAPERRCQRELQLRALWRARRRHRRP